MNVEQKFEQLKLALEWNRADIVKSLILKDDRDWNVENSRTKSHRECFVVSLENQFK